MPVMLRIRSEAKKKVIDRNFSAAEASRSVAMGALGHQRSIARMGHTPYLTKYILCVPALQIKNATYPQSIIGHIGRMYFLSQDQYSALLY